MTPAEALDYAMRDSVRFHGWFRVVAGSHKAGLMLATMIKWTNAMRRKYPETPEKWQFWHTTDQFQSELSLSWYEQRTARRKLLERGIISETKNKQNKVTYLLNLDILGAKLAEVADIAIVPTPRVASPPKPSAEPAKSPAPVKPSAMEQLLLSHGVTPGKARFVAANHTVQEIQRQIEWMKHRTSLTSPSGALVKAITENWPAPEQAAEEIKASKKTEKMKRVAATEAEAAAERDRRLGEAWGRLSADRQQEIEKEARRRLKHMIKGNTPSERNQAIIHGACLQILETQLAEERPPP